MRNMLRVIERIEYEIKCFKDDDDKYRLVRIMKDLALLKQSAIDMGLVGEDYEPEDKQSPKDYYTLFDLSIPMTYDRLKLWFDKSENRCTIDIKEGDKTTHLEHVKVTDNGDSTVTIEGETRAG